MSLKPLNRLGDSDRSRDEGPDNDRHRDEPLRRRLTQIAAVQAPSAPPPPASPLIIFRVRSITQEEARLHWHHRDLPVSRFSACMMLPG